LALVRTPAETEYIAAVRARQTLVPRYATDVQNADDRILLALRGLVKQYTPKSTCCAVTSS
jgi:hypothetical protein